jgi:nucleotide-binding universal stress UspA family protein
MAGSIICGVDDSESAEGAARVARALSGELGLGLVFVRVVDPRASRTNVRAIAERLEQLTADAAETDNGAAWLVDAGHPADGLVAAAKKADAAMIVVGSTGPHSSLLGSVSADVSRRAPCPVVVVPPGADVRVNGRSDGHDVDRDLAGGITRFGGRDGATDVAGGVIRFGLGPAASRVTDERSV